MRFDQFVSRQRSPAPLRTALERELGLEPRLAKEVEEIAEDIRRELLARRSSATPVPIPTSQAKKPYSASPSFLNGL